jgi:hypothetical protein
LKFNFPATWGRGVWRSSLTGATGQRLFNARLCLNWKISD